ncbi:MAG: hypothetical protein LBC86_09570 [Oscillospiraceae bacterium]|nr:hypothetical protein [Oscillospiraceae bacterium]
MKKGLDENMNRIEIVGMFTALSRLCEKKDMEGIEQIVNAVLEEAKTAKSIDKKTEDKE